MLQELLELEQQGWRALSSDAETSKQFYRLVLHEDAVMLFPGDGLICGKAQILTSLAAQPWKSFEIEAPRVISLAENAGVLTYRVVAQREGGNPYIALISSTYVKTDGAWKLILHQQTPK